MYGMFYLQHLTVFSTWILGKMPNVLTLMLFVYVCIHTGVCGIPAQRWHSTQYVLYIFYIYVYIIYTFIFVII